MAWQSSGNPTIRIAKMHPLSNFIQVLTLSLLGTLLAVHASAAELMGTHTDWKTYRHSHRGETLCFAVARASEQKPSGGDREAPHLYVTAWPKAGIKAEVSIILGYTLEKGAEVTVDVSGTTFTLVADGDRAYIGDAGEEPKLLDAMRRGKVMTVEATSDTGTRSRDVFSLLGVTASIQAIAASCG